MRQSEVDLSKLLAIAYRAGDGVMEIYRSVGVTAGSVSLKDDDSPLTQADLLSHKLICQGLSALTPDIPIVSEEDDGSLRHRTASGRFWLIDPLDGTREFIARNGEFTVNIALIEEGAPVLGVVFAPAQNSLYWGSVGIGAFRNIAGRVEPIAATRAHRLSNAMRVVASKSHMNAETLRFISALGAHEMVQAGSSLKFCRIAEGTADVYPRLGPTCEWDTAAAQAVVEAAGGHVYTMDGSKLIYGKPDVLNPHFVASALPPSELIQLL